MTQCDKVCCIDLFPSLTMIEYDNSDKLFLKTSSTWDMPASLLTEFLLLCILKFGHSKIRVMASIDFINSWFGIRFWLPFKENLSVLHAQAVFPIKTRQFYLYGTWFYVWKCFWLRNYLIFQRFLISRSKQRYILKNPLCD